MISYLRIEKVIDGKILKSLKSLNSLESTNIILEEYVEKYSKRDSFMDVSKYIILKEWRDLSFINRYNTYFVIYCKERIKDINWLIENRDNIKNDGDNY